MLHALGLSNSLTGRVLAYCSFTLPFTVWIMQAYFETVPAELDRSALVDGCNPLQAYYRVAALSRARSAMRALSRWMCGSTNDGVVRRLTASIS